MCCDFLEPEDEALICTPSFFMYDVSIQMMTPHLRKVQAGATLEFPFERFMAAITKQTKLIIVASPNNPTGAAATREQLEAWVKYALEHKSVILFDAAYEAYISDPELPRSIYEIPGAKDCAIELRSFSKRAGFTGVRCAFMVVPKEVTGIGAGGARVSFAEIVTDKGHDAFLLQEPELFAIVSGFLEGAAKARGLPPARG